MIRVKKTIQSIRSSRAHHFPAGLAANLDLASNRLRALTPEVVDNEAFTLLLLVAVEAPKAVEETLRAGTEGWSMLPDVV